VCLAGEIAKQFKIGGGQPATTELRQERANSTAESRGGKFQHGQNFIRCTNICRHNGFRLRVLPSQTKWDLDPKFLLSSDTGGKTPHIHYRCRDGTVRDIPSTNEAIHPRSWSLAWMKPEPMHAVETLEVPDSNRPPDLRMEIKCRR
jgi:hypothetical protein